MRQEFITDEELDEEVRLQKLSDLTEVKAIYLEAGGDISVAGKSHDARAQSSDISASDPHEILKLSPSSQLAKHGCDDSLLNDEWLQMVALKALIQLRAQVR